MKNLLILLLLIITTTEIWAQVPVQAAGPGMKPGMGPGGPGAIPKNGIIKGKIVDAETKAPMQYATVSIYKKPDTKLLTGGITNESGQFEIDGLAYGDYSLEAIFIGFQKTTVKDLKIVPNSSTLNLGTIELAVSREQIETVEVVADKKRIEYKIDKKVINVSQDVNASGGSAVTVLENTPSVEVDIDGNVSLRGSSNFTVLIDGRPSVLSGSDALKQIPSSVIQNIEIITNPSVKYDPDGQAGIINIVMKKNVLAGVNGVLNLNAGTGKKYGADLTLNYKTKKYNLFAGVNWNDNTDFGTMKMTRETYRNDTTTYLTTEGRRNQSRGGDQFKLGLDYFLTEKTSVTVSGQLGKFNFDGSGGGNLHKYQVPGTLNIYSVQDNNSSRGGNFISADASFLTKYDEMGTHKLEGSFSYRNRDGLSDETIDEYLSDSNYGKSTNYLSQVVTDENSNSDEYRAKIDYTLPLAKGSKFEAGAQSRMEREKEDFHFTNFGIFDPKFSSGMIYKEDIHSIYSTYSGNLKTVKFELGLRGEYTNRSIENSNVSTPYTLNRFDFFPSAHFSYEFLNKSQVMASYSKRINRPDGRDLDPFPNYMNQYAIRIGNPNLKPEYTDSYEFSFIKNFEKSFISIETFFRTTNNLITRLQRQEGEISYMTMDNLNRDYSTGGEIMFNSDLNKWLLLNTSFSLFNYQMKGEVLGKSIDKQSTNYSGRLNATIKFNADSRLQLTGFYRGPSVSAQGDQKGMVFTNLSYRQDLMKKKLTATVSVRDVLGTMKMQGTSFGDGFKSTFKMQREPRVIMLTLSYKINNYKMDRQAPQEQQGGGGEDLF